MKTWLMTLTLAAGLMAQPPEGRGPGRQHRGGAAPVSALKQTLGLTDDQVDKLRQLQKSQRTAMEPLAKQMAEKQRALHQAMREGTAEQAGKTALAEIETVRKQMATARAANRTQAVALLNPAQKQKLQALEEAAKLMASVREAAMLDLVEAPMGGPPAGPGLMMRRGR